MASLLDFGPTKCDLDKLNTVWMEITASQIFHPTGSHFIFLDANGRVSLALTASPNLWGWALAPHTNDWGSVDAVNGYWTSAAAAPYTKLEIIPFLWNPGLVYKVPSTLAGGLSALARCGEVCDIVGANNGSRQYVAPGTISTKVLCFGGIDLNGDTDSCFVTINDATAQKDVA